ncbi:MAG: hypothetical protein M1826_006258 [Phylliscum demangeonii]|nr:MAG: hypothetical protein M1826_006258 [Phylliscum demangeonii]
MGGLALAEGFVEEGDGEEEEEEEQEGRGSAGTKGRGCESYLFLDGVTLSVINVANVVKLANGFTPSSTAASSTHLEFHLSGVEDIWSGEAKKNMDAVRSEICVLSGLVHDERQKVEAKLIYQAMMDEKTERDEQDRLALLEDKRLEAQWVIPGSHRYLGQHREGEFDRPA